MIVDAARRQKDYSDIRSTHPVRYITIIVQTLVIAVHVIAAFMCTCSSHESSVPKTTPCSTMGIYTCDSMKSSRSADGAVLNLSW